MGGRLLHQHNLSETVRRLQHTHTTAVMYDCSYVLGWCSERNYCSALGMKRDPWKLLKSCPVHCTAAMFCSFGVYHMYVVNCMPLFIVCHVMSRGAWVELQCTWREGGLMEVVALPCRAAPVFRYWLFTLKPPKMLKSGGLNSRLEYIWRQCWQWYSS